MTGPKPIRVTYNGIRYRSALEADWAATFTDLGIYFEYEPQPWRMPSGAVYDCDFYLPNMRTYCEAKGPHNERLWKPREFAAALKATEYPRAFQVVVLRPAGPRAEAVWEPADPTDDCPWLTECDGCHLWAFTDRDEWGKRYCRRCYSEDVLLGAVRSGLEQGLHRELYLTMRRAPRWAA